jgi:hypothetical protein
MLEAELQRALKFFEDFLEITFAVRCISGRLSVGRTNRRMSPGGEKQPG